MGLPGRHSPSATVQPTSAEEKELCTHKASIHQPWVVNAKTHTQTKAGLDGRRGTWNSKHPARLEDKLHPLDPSSAHNQDRLVTTS